MKYQYTPTAAAPDLVESAEGRLALRITALLHGAAEQTPHDIGERLRVAREQALAQARRAHKLSAAPAVVVQGPGHAAVLGGPPSVWWRLASALPLLVLVAGLVLIEQHHAQEQINTAAEIDAALLADELPPTAYGDPGFTEYLRGTPTP